MGIAVVGDCMLARGVTPHAIVHGLRDLIAGIAPATQHRFVITNLETPLCDVARVEPRVSAPRFRAPTRFASQLRDVGIVAVNLANNHMFDCGVDGFMETAAALDAVGIQWFGAGRHATEAHRPAIIECDGKRVGLLGGSYRPIAGAQSPGVADCYATQFLDAIRVARASVDVLLVFVHAGIELLPYPLPREQQTYRAYIAAGADLVVGSHPHCVQAWEEYRGKMIFYSIGDLLFDHFDDDVWQGFRRVDANAMRYAPDADRTRLRESILLTIETGAPALRVGVRGVISDGHVPRPRLHSEVERTVWFAEAAARNERFTHDRVLQQELAAIDRECHQRRISSV